MRFTLGSLHALPPSSVLSWLFYTVLPPLALGLLQLMQPALEVKHCLNISSPWGAEAALLCFACPPSGSEVLQRGTSCCARRMAVLVEVASLNICRS